MAFSSKKEVSMPDMVVDPQVEAAVLQSAKDGMLACAVCFRLAEKWNISPGVVGHIADIHRIRLVKCQLGLFGIGPGKNKGILKVAPVPEELAWQIQNHIEGGKLPCRAAWKMAAEMNIPKMTISGACETMEIRIKECQIGAF